MKYKLLDLLTEYKETNKDSLYEPVAVGKYGIRKRNEIYKKELSDDYSKNKVIRDNTLIVGMGSNQIDIGVLSDDEIYSVSPAYHTYRINIQVVGSDYLDLLFKANNANYFRKYSIATARQGKKIDLKSLLNEIVDIPSFEEQDIIIGKIFDINELIRIEEKSLSLLDELTKSRFNELFGPIQYMSDSNHSIGDVCELNPRKDSLDDSIEITFIPMEKVGVDGSLKLDLLRKYGDIKKGFSQIRENDVLFAKITPCMENGKATIARGLINGYAGGTTELFVIRCGNEVLPEYIFHIVHSQYFRDKAKPNMRGTVGQQRVGKEFIESFPIDVPNLEKQKEFASFVEQVDKLKFFRLGRNYHDFYESMEEICA